MYRMLFIFHGGRRAQAPEKRSSTATEVAWVPRAKARNLLNGSASGAVWPAPSGWGRMIGSGLRAVGPSGPFGSNGFGAGASGGVWPLAEALATSRKLVWPGTGLGSGESPDLSLELLTETNSNR